VQIINGTSLSESVIELRYAESTYDDDGPSFRGRDRGEARRVRGEELGWRESVLLQAKDTTSDIRVFGSNSILYV